MDFRELITRRVSEGVGARSTRLTAQILLFVLLVASVALILNALSFRERLADVHIAHSDNLGWVIAQLEVDHQALMLALSVPRTVGGASNSFETQELNFEHVKREFDILYSRISIFAATVDRLFVSEDMRAQTEAVVRLRDDLALQLDSIDLRDEKAIEGFATNVSAAYPMVRSLTTAALQETVDMATRSRNAEASQYQRFIFQSVFLVVLMWAGIILVVRLWRALEASSQQATRVATTLTTAFNSTLNGVIITDARFNVLYCNRVTCDLLGYEPPELEERSLNELVRLDEVLSPKQRMFSWALSNNVKVGGPGEPAKRGVCYRRDGSECQVEISLASELSSSGQEIIIAFIRDISDRIAAERKQQVALQEAEKAGRAKSHFLATMSHEMRTPLHGLIASLDLINATPLDPESKELLATARDCSSRTLMQVNDVLELTRLGEKREAMSEFRPDLVASDIVQELRPLAEKSNNTISFELHGEFETAKSYGMPIAFSRTLYNLIGNAIKFTQGGDIRVRLRFIAEEPGAAKLRVEISDTGIGVSESDQSRIFESFETATPSELSHLTGTGLGLAIVRMAVAEQGGTLELESELGVGSCFRFEVPLGDSAFAEDRSALATSASLPQVSDNATPTGGMSQKHVLIVDDHEVNRTLVATMLKRLGHTVETANDGTEAVEIAYRTYFDAILMDFSMPRMDGPTAADTIRNGDGVCRDVPIIGVTALIEPYALRQKSPQMSSVLTKPFSLSELENALNACEDVVLLENSATERDCNQRDTKDVKQVCLSLCEKLGEEKAKEFLSAILSDCELALKAAEASGDSLEERAEIVHRAVGSTAVVGLVDLSNALSDCEVTLRDGGEPRVELLVEKVVDLRGILSGTLSRIES